MIFYMTRIADQYGNHTGNIDISTGRITDQYGNHIGNVDVSTGRITDQYGNHIGNVDVSTGRITDQYGNHRSSVDIETYQKRTTSVSTPQTDSSGCLTWMIDKVVYLVIIILIAWGVSRYYEKNRDVTENEPEYTPVYTEDAINHASSDIKGIWSTAYLAVLTEFESTYGIGIDRDSWKMGLVYATLVDLAGDNIDEMICLVDQKLMLYTYQDDKATLLLSREIYPEFGSTDVNGLVYFSEVDGYLWIGVNNPTNGNEWNEDFRTSYSVNDGQITQIDFHAWRESSSEFPTISTLTEFRINETAVSKEQYIECINMYFNSDTGYVLELWSLGLSEDCGPMLRDLMKSLEV